MKTGFFNEITLTLIGETCAKCGVAFGMTQEFMAKRRETGADFYCPNGHVLTYGRGEIGRLRDELARKEHQVEQVRASRDHAWKRVEEERTERRGVERKLAATKGVVTRVKNRVKNGVCPCCNRTFDDLARHMKTQHPEFGATEEG